MKHIHASWVSLKFFSLVLLNDMTIYRYPFSSPGFGFSTGAFKPKAFYMYIFWLSWLRSWWHMLQG